jgi:hypothetical protein
MKYKDLFDANGLPMNHPLATYFTFRREPNRLCMAISGRKYIVVAATGAETIRGTIGSANYELAVIEQFPKIEWDDTDQPRSDE